jgi:integrase/recombinase XerD
MLHRQAKVLSSGQIRALLKHIGDTRHPVRNRAIFMLSLRAGLRAKEIAALEWRMITDAEGQIAAAIRLTDSAAKGRSGGAIPMAAELRQSLDALRQISWAPFGKSKVVATERATSTSAQVIVNMFAEWYSALGFDGCSSHSGRRTFITMAARNIGRFGGSLRDVQALARHSSLAMTQRYIEIDSRAMARVVDGW